MTEEKKELNDVRVVRFNFRFDLCQSGKQNGGD